MESDKKIVVISPEKIFEKILEKDKVTKEIHNRMMKLMAENSANFCEIMIEGGKQRLVKYDAKKILKKFSKERKSIQGCI